MAISPKEMMRRVGEPTRLILFLSVLVVAASVALAVIVFSGETSPEAGAETLAPAATTDGSTGGNGEQGAQPTGTTSDAFAVLATDDPVDAAVTEACRQFRAGANVADFAEWFESGWVHADGEAEAVFREVIEKALTQACPEVVPSD